MSLKGAPVTPENSNGVQEVAGRKKVTKTSSNINTMCYSKEHDSSLGTVMDSRRRDQIQATWFQAVGRETVIKVYTNIWMFGAYEDRNYTSKKCCDFDMFRECSRI